MSDLKLSTEITVESSQAKKAIQDIGTELTNLKGIIEKPIGQSNLSTLTTDANKAQQPIKDLITEGRNLYQTFNKELNANTKEFNNQLTKSNTEVKSLDTSLNKLQQQTNTQLKTITTEFDKGITITVTESGKLETKIKELFNSSQQNLKNITIELLKGLEDTDGKTKALSDKIKTLDSTLQTEFKDPTSLTKEGLNKVITAAQAVETEYNKLDKGFTKSFEDPTINTVKGLKQLEDTLNKSESAIKTSSDVLEGKYKQALTDISGKVTEFNGKVTTTETEINNLNNKLNTNSGESFLVAPKQHIDQLNDLIKKVENEIQTLTNEFNKQFPNPTAEVKAGFDKLILDLENAKKEITTIRNNSQEQLNNFTTNIDNGVKGLNSNLTSLNDTVKTVKNSTNENVHNSFSALNDGVNQAKQSLVSLETTVTQVRSQAQTNLNDFTTQVREGATNTGAKLNELGTGIKITSGHINEASKIIDEHKTKHDQLKESVLQLHQAYYTLQTAIQALSIIKNTVTDFNEFDDAARRAWIAAGEGTTSLEALKKAASNIGPELGKTSTEAAQALQQLVQAGYSAKDAIATLPTVLKFAELSQISTSEATTKLVRVLNEFGLEAKDMSRVGDILTATSDKTTTSIKSLAYGLSYVGPMAHTVGLSLQETTAILGLLADKGDDGSKSGTRLRAILGQLIEPSEKTQAAFDKLGVAIADVNTGKMRPLIDILTELNTKVSNGTISSTQLAGAAYTAFGKISASTFVGLANTGGEKIRELASDVANQTNAMDNNFAKLESGMKGATDKMSASWDGFKNALVEAYSPAMENTFNGMTNLLGGVVDSMEFFPPLTAAVGAGIAWVGTEAALAAGLLNPLAAAILAGTTIAASAVSIYGGLASSTEKVTEEVKRNSVAITEQNLIKAANTFLITANNLTQKEQSDVIKEVNKQTKESIATNTEFRKKLKDGVIVLDEQNQRLYSSRDAGNELTTVLKNISDKTGVNVVTTSQLSLALEKGAITLNTLTEGYKKGAAESVNYYNKTIEVNKAIASAKEEQVKYNNALQGSIDKLKELQTSYANEINAFGQISTVRQKLADLLLNEKNLKQDNQTATTAANKSEHQETWDIKVLNEQKQALARQQAIEDKDFHQEKLTQLQQQITKALEGYNQQKAIFYASDKSDKASIESQQKLLDGQLTEINNLKKLATDQQTYVITKNAEIKAAEILNNQYTDRYTQQNLLNAVYQESDKQLRAISASQGVYLNANTQLNTSQQQTTTINSELRQAYKDLGNGVAGAADRIAQLSAGYNQSTTATNNYNGTIYKSNTALREHEQLTLELGDKKLWLNDIENQLNAANINYKSSVDKLNNSQNLSVDQFDALSKEIDTNEQSVNKLTTQKNTLTATINKLSASVSAYENITNTTSKSTGTYSDTLGNLTQNQSNLSTNTTNATTELNTNQQAMDSSKASTDANATATNTLTTSLTTTKDATNSLADATGQATTKQNEKIEAVKTDASETTNLIKPIEDITNARGNEQTSIDSLKSKVDELIAKRKEELPAFDEVDAKVKQRELNEQLTTDAIKLIIDGLINKRKEEITTITDISNKNKERENIEQTIINNIKGLIDQLINKRKEELTVFDNIKTKSNDRAANEQTNINLIKTTITDLINKRQEEVKAIEDVIKKQNDRVNNERANSNEIKSIIDSTNNARDNEIKKLDDIINKSKEVKTEIENLNTVNLSGIKTELDNILTSIDNVFNKFNGLTKTLNDSTSTWQAFNTNAVQSLITNIANLEKGLV